MASVNIFSHGGDLGDLIAGLPCLIQHGGGELALHGAGRVREPFAADKVKRISSLLLLQPYVSAVRFTERPEGIPLDRWRRRRVRHGRNRPRPVTIVDWHTDKAHQPPWPQDKGWLVVDEPRREASTVFNRTSRYQGDVRVMKWAWSACGADAVFLGTLAEWEAFTNEVGFARHVETPTLLDAARIIAGARLFCGNQSSFLWVAHGLQIDVLVEEWKTDPNCHLIRPGARYGIDN